MKKISWILIIIVLAALIVVGLRVFWGGGEDNWIKDEKGIWIKHGSPSGTPDYVTEQQDAMGCAGGLYENAKNEGMEFNSQCLGTCGNYSVDIVNVPRTNDDNLPENQCTDFRDGKTMHFIELDKNSEIVRVI